MGDETVVVVPFTEIDAANADQFAAWLAQFRHERVVLDVRDVEYLDSSGLRVIAVEDEARGRPEPLQLRNATRTVRRVFEVCGLGRHLEGSRGESQVRTSVP